MKTRTLALVFGLAFAAIGCRAEIVLQEKVALLAVPHQGPFVRTSTGEIWGMDERGALISRDEGRTWEARAIFDPARFTPSKERALFRTKEGVLLYAFLNNREKVFKWDDARGGPQEGCRLPVYLSRSDDDGKAWAAPVRLQEGWCGAVRQMIQLRSGRIVLVSQQAAANPGRHVTLIHTSDDLGKTWRAEEPIDLGARGNYQGKSIGLTGSTHGGGIEGTVLEKQNGELRLLLRVPHGHFEEMTSKDGGTSWIAAMPSTLEASDSPGMMVRLASGRVALVWNRYTEPTKKLGRREELSLAFSSDDGRTWTTPQVIAVNRVPQGARESAYWISYPYVFEPVPGQLWISTMQGNLRAALKESDFVSAVEKPLGGAVPRVIMLGDSITRGARPGVSPTQIFATRTQALLGAAGVRADVHNVGVGGERTDLALVRLERDVISQRPHVVAVMYGTNDSWVDVGKTESRLSEKQFEDNLRQIVQRLTTAKIRVVLMTEPRFGERNQRNGLGEEPNLRLGRYMELTRKIARETGSPLIDHFAGWETAQRGGKVLQDWTTDGCHPNAEGHSEIAQRIATALEPLLR